MPPKKHKAAQRVLVDGLTEEQDEVLRTVQYRQGNLSGRDSFVGGFLQARFQSLRLERSHSLTLLSIKEEELLWVALAKHRA